MYSVPCFIFQLCVRMNTLMMSLIVKKEQHYVVSEKFDIKITHTKLFFVY